MDEVIPREMLHEFSGYLAPDFLVWIQRHMQAEINLRQVRLREWEKGCKLKVSTPIDIIVNEKSEPLGHYRAYLTGDGFDIYRGYFLFEGANMHRGHPVNEEDPRKFFLIAEVDIHRQQYVQAGNADFSKVPFPTVNNVLYNALRDANSRPLTYLAEYKIEQQLKKA